MTMTQDKPFRVVREFDHKAARFRQYKVCSRCDQRSQFNSRTSTPLCSDCVAALTPQQRTAWQS